MSQVHKENLTAVDNALPNRAGLDIEIFGMEGIPEDIVQQHTQRVLTNYHQAQADRQGGAGSAQGGSSASAPKKPKIESVSDIKKRLAEHKAAKLAGEKENGGSSGGTTPKPAASVSTQAQPQGPSVSFPVSWQCNTADSRCRPHLPVILGTSNRLMPHHPQTVRTVSLPLTGSLQL